MTPGATIFVLGMLALHAIAIVVLYRRDMRHERAARERKRSFRQSLINRRGR